MCRAFVKCVAIHTGLGFDLWLDEESENGKFDDITPIHGKPPESQAGEDTGHRQHDREQHSADDNGKKSHKRRLDNRNQP